MKDSLRVPALLLALLLFFGCALGLSLRASPAEAAVKLPGLSWPVERAEGPSAASYPYILRTENAVWHLSKDDMELLGEEAYCEGLERILQDQEADFAEAQALLSPWLREEIPPIDIFTDFCGHAEGDEMFGAFYRGSHRDIRLFHNWDMAAVSLLHEYVHYLTFSCTDDPVSEGLFAEGVAEYVSRFACRNRMFRIAAFYGMSEDDKRLAGEWNLLDEDGCLDPARQYFYLAEEIKSPAGLGMKYNTITNAIMVRDERINQNPSYTTISYYEAGSILAYLVDRFGEELVFGNWGMDPYDLKEVFGEDFSALYRDWDNWNRAKCHELRIAFG